LEINVRVEKEALLAQGAPTYGKLVSIRFVIGSNLLFSCVITGFCRKVNGNCHLLGYYVASIGNSLPTFRDILSVPSSRFKNPKNVIIYYDMI